MKSRLAILLALPLPIGASDPAAVSSSLPARVRGRFEFVADSLAKANARH